MAGIFLDVVWGVLIVAVVLAVAIGAFFASEAVLHRVVQGDGKQLPVSSEVQSVLSAFPHASVIVDPSGNVLRADAKAHSYGLISERHISQPEIIELVRQARRDGTVVETELRVMRAGDQSRAPINLNVRVASLIGGKIVILAEDVTSRHRAEAARRDFTANVSHELKTPVSSIKLLVETIENHADDEQAVRHFAHLLEKESTHLAALVHDIIELSRLDQSDGLRDRENIAITSIVDEALSSRRFQAGAAMIDLRWAQRDEAMVAGSRTMLVTAVSNLVDNAIRYSAPQTAVEIATIVDGDHVMISVKDHGIGIAAEHHERIFERFFRSDPARSRTTGGTGLGLSIVKHVTSIHGGSVSVDSVLGEGSEFTLKLPIAVLTRGHERSDR